MRYKYVLAGRAGLFARLVERLVAQQHPARLFIQYNPLLSYLGSLLILDLIGYDLVFYNSDSQVLANDCAVQVDFLGNGLLDRSETF